MKRKSVGNQTYRCRLSTYDMKIESTGVDWIFIP